jgi:hypothetical protein
LSETTDGRSVRHCAEVLQQNIRKSRFFLADAGIVILFGLENFGWRFSLRFPGRLLQKPASAFGGRYA